jgi:hypothetical protein
VRRRILELLADSELSSGAITAAVQEEFGTQPASRSTCGVRRDNGFARVRPEGPGALARGQRGPTHDTPIGVARRDGRHPGGQMKGILDELGNTDRGVSRRPHDGRRWPR